MRLRVRKEGSFGDTRIESLGRIDNVLIRESLDNPLKKVVSVYFKGSDSSGIIDLTQEEMNTFFRLEKPSKATKTRENKKSKTRK